LARAAPVEARVRHASSNEDHAGGAHRTAASPQGARRASVATIYLEMKTWLVRRALP
jgi:hypothetical protein